MDEKENFGFEAEENTEAVETVEEGFAEEAEEIVEGEAFEEAAEEVTAEEETTEEAAVPAKKKGGAGKAIAIAVVAVLVIAAVVFGVVKYINRNPYNEMGYINVSGRTLEDVYVQAGYDSLDEFLADYGLPADMPADTEEAAAYYNIPAGKIAEMYGMDIDTLKQLLGLGDEVTEDTTWGDAEGKATLAKYVGEDNLESFKAEYGLGDEVTADTLWSEVRNAVDEKTLKDQKEAEKAAKEEKKNDTADDEEESDASDEADAEADADAE